MPPVSILIESVGFIGLSAGITRAMLLSAGGKGMTGAGTWPYVIFGLFATALSRTHMPVFSMLLGRTKRLASVPYGAAA